MEKKGEKSQQALCQSVRMCLSRLVSIVVIGGENSGVMVSHPSIRRAYVVVGAKENFVVQ